MHGMSPGNRGPACGARVTADRSAVGQLAVDPNWAWERTLPPPIKLREQPAQPLIPGIGMEPLMPVLRNMEVRYLDRQLENCHIDPIRTGSGEPVRHHHQQVRARDNRGNAHGVRYMDRHTPLDAGGPERLVDKILLRAVTAPGGVIDQLRRLQKMLERQGVADARMTCPHHPDIMLLKQHLAVNGALELLEV